MVKKEVLSALLDEKKMAVLRILFQSPEEVYLSEIASKSNVSVTSTFRILRELAALGIVYKKEWKTSKVYGCLKNEKVDFLRDLLQESFDGLSEFIKAAETIVSIQQIIQHGPKKEGKANVLLIGDSIETAKVEEVCKAIKDKGFELSYLTLTKGQYEQMVKMGLYSGEKKVLK